VPEPAEVKLMRDGTILKYAYAGKRISITLPKELRTNLDDVIEVRWKEDWKK
jgi:hypothetical protein